MKKIDKTLLIRIIVVFMAGLVTLGISYSVFTKTKTTVNQYAITVGNFSFDIGSEANPISLTAAYPMTDTVGKTTTPYTFTITNNSSVSVNYTMELYSDTTNTLPNNLVKVYLVQGSNVVGPKTLEDTTMLYQGSMNGGASLSFSLRLWLHEDATTDISGKTFKAKIKVNAVTSETEMTVQEPTVSNLTMTTTVSDPNGLDSYAITTYPVSPSADSDEWISISSSSAKNIVVRTSTVTSKTISFMVKKNGTYYLHVKNKFGQIKTTPFTTNATGTTATTKIMNLASTNTSELRIDTHSATGNQNFSATEYRYFGANPNNYVWFNNELWRIIGVMYVDNGSGTLQNRLKIIRSESIGDYSWDSSDSSVNGGYGVNEWSQADIMTLLNSGDYYNRLNTYSSNGLISDAKEMIGNAKWYLGAHSSNSVTSETMYSHERSSLSGKQCVQDEKSCSDSVVRKTLWVGKIGLIYPSDYGYAANMNSCSETNISSYYQSCKYTTWLYKSSNIWTISPTIISSAAYYVFFINSNGILNYFQANSEFGILPAVYLNADVKILDGDGTTDRPFILSN